MIHSNPYLTNASSRPPFCWPVKLQGVILLMHLGALRVHRSTLPHYLGVIVLIDARMHITWLQQCLASSNAMTYYV